MNLSNALHRMALFMGRSAVFALLSALIATLLLLPLIPAYDRSPLEKALDYGVDGFYGGALPIGIFSGMLFNAIVLRSQDTENYYRMITLPAIITALSITGILGMFVSINPLDSGGAKVYVFFTLLAFSIIALTAYLLRKITRDRKPLIASLVITVLIIWAIMPEGVLRNLALTSTPPIESTPGVKQSSN